MCYHTPREVRKYLARAAKSGHKQMSVVIMREPGTLKFQEAYHCEAHSPQSIANVIRNLRAWHPEEHVVDLTQVNDKRRHLSKSDEFYRDFFKDSGQKLDLTEADLPKPEGKAPRSEDEALDRSDDMVDPALKKLVRKPLAEPTQAEMVATFDEGQNLKRTKMAVEHALKHGFPQSREPEVLAESAGVMERETVAVRQERIR